MTLSICVGSDAISYAAGAADALGASDGSAECCDQHSNSSALDKRRDPDAHDHRSEASKNNATQYEETDISRSLDHLCRRQGVPPKRNRSASATGGDVCSEARHRRTGRIR